jgi:hypothetical protein
MSYPFFPVFPSVSTRLSRPQYELIAPAFKRIAALHALCMANRVKPIFYLYEFSPRPTTLKGRYDQAIMPAFLNLGTRLASLFSTPGGSHRLRLTALEIEFLMYAARVTRKQVAHGHIDQPANYSTTKNNPLIKKAGGGPQACEAALEVFSRCLGGVSAHAGALGQIGTMDSHRPSLLHV